VAARTNVNTLRTQDVAVVLLGLARIHLKLAHAASPSVAARAFERVDHVSARAAVHARRRFTLVRIDFAVVAAVAVSANTAVSKRVVKAAATIEAWCGGALV